MKKYGLILALALSSFILGCSGDSSLEKTSEPSQKNKPEKSPPAQVKDDPEPKVEISQKPSKNSNKNKKIFPNQTSESEESLIPKARPSLFQKPLYLKLIYKKNKSASKKVHIFRCKKGDTCPAAVFLSQVQFQKKTKGCLQIYGGPETARLFGFWGKRKIRGRFSMESGCEIERFETIKPLIAAARF